MKVLSVRYDKNNILIFKKFNNLTCLFVPRPLPIGAGLCHFVITLFRLFAKRKDEITKKNATRENEKTKWHKPATITTTCNNIQVNFIRLCSVVFGKYFQSTRIYEFLHRLFRV